jgi:hypothetical protein
MSKRIAKKSRARTSARRVTRRTASSGTKRKASAKAKTSSRASAVDPVLAPVRGAERRELGHVTLEVGRAGAARVKRMIYPAGFHWEKDMKAAVGTDFCMHAHVGFLVRGEIHIEYEDGCVVEFKAPQVVAIEPGHDGWVVGNGPAVMIEFDFERDTVSRTGMPARHQH